MSENTLPEDRLATTDEHGKRVYLHPEDIKGKWKSRRTFFYWFLILLYLVLPWIYIDGQQIILLDLPKREFHIFGNTFYGHDAPLLIFILLGFLFLIAFVTSLWGRVWCGWACPQTVFIDAIYRKIERLIEGKSRQRKALDRAPWSFEKIWKRGLKWILFIAVSMHIVHSFLGYFVGTHKLFWITMGSPFENWALFLTMLVMTGIILFDFGWFKEQFCIIACPYGRMQSVIMDEQSMIVAYDNKRGEPRRSPDIAREAEGDCINCKRCVKACPTGIDIRNGTQMECIACTMCIDACDEIMTKLKQPKGLIRYTSEKQLNGEPKKLRFRNFLYLIILIGLVTGGVVSLSKRQELRVQYIRGSQSPFQTSKVGDKIEVINHYALKLNYYGAEKYTIDLQIDDRNLREQIEVVSPSLPLDMEEQNEEAIIFFKFSPSILNNGQLKIKVNVLNAVDEDFPTLLKQTEVNLVGPIK
jgi:cytochrome c oxidase accessory protein FixG